jgi:predicted phage tail protein
MLKKVTLYGDLGEKYGKDWVLDVRSPAEAIKALCINNPGLKQNLMDSESNNIGYQVVVGSSYIEKEKDLLVPSMRMSDIKIIPVVLGAKSKVGKIIVGAIMIYLAYNYGYTEGAGLGEMTFLGKIAMNIGVSMVMSGVAELLAPKPAAPRDANTLTGHTFSGPQNTVKQGVPIPVCYGQLIVGGAVISGGILAEDSDGS